MYEAHDLVQFTISFVNKVVSLVDFRSFSPDIGFKGGNLEGWATTKKEGYFKDNVDLR
jgi:hypothetical protein